MQFVPYRLFRNHPRELRQKLSQEGHFVITNNGEPFALMVNIENGEVEEMLHLITQLRAQQPVSALRAQARTHGLDQISPTEIDAERQAVREGR